MRFSAAHGERPRLRLTELSHNARGSRSALLHYAIWVLAGAAVLVVATWLGVRALDALAGARLRELDAAILIGLDRLAGPAGDVIAFSVTALGARAVGAVLILIATKFLWPERPLEVLFVWTALLGTLLGDLLKLVFGRVRPDLVPWSSPVTSLTTPAFPSGHSLAAMVVFGALALVLLRGARTPGERAAIIVGAVLVVAAVGWSRVQLGVHYPTDVVGGWVVGAAWLVVADRATRFGHA